MPPIALPAQDPNLEPLPNLNGPGYHGLRNFIIAQALDITPEQAVLQIQTSYNADRQT